MMIESMERARVLIVDDHKDTAEALADCLEAAGYAVVVTGDGESALDAAWKFAPDACVLDINMPGMDGYELARRLREMRPERSPVLATLTGHDDFEHLDRAVEAGFDLHFSKPANPNELVEQLGACIEEATSVLSYAR